MTGTHSEIRAYFRALRRAWGPQHWWPARTRFEVIVGAYLTQNTSWTNVEKALANLRAARVLSASGIRRTSLRNLQRLIRPSGYFRQKAKRLKTFVEFLDRRYAGSLAKMFAEPTSQLRAELLAVNGIGPETADSILLYAGNHSVFVVDAYTRRILERHRVVPSKSTYEDVQRVCESALTPICDEASFKEKRADSTWATGAGHLPSIMSTAPRSPLTQVYNEMHGLIVGVGKKYCLKSQPRCDECPLQKFLPLS